MIRETARFQYETEPAHREFGGPLRTTAFAVATKYVQIALCQIVKELTAFESSSSAPGFVLKPKSGWRDNRGTDRFADRSSLGLASEREGDDMIVPPRDQVSGPSFF